MQNLKSLLRREVFVADEWFGWDNSLVKQTHDGLLCYVQLNPRVHLQYSVFAGHEQPVAQFFWNWIEGSYCLGDTAAKRYPVGGCVTERFPLESRQGIFGWKRTFTEATVRTSRMQDPDFVNGFFADPDGRDLVSIEVSPVNP